VSETDQLNFRVRLVCELLKDRNEDKPTGGRPTKEDRRLLIVKDMLEAIERHGVEERGSVEAAFKDVVQRHSTTYRYVRNVYYSPDPKWRRAVLLRASKEHARARRDLEAFLSEKFRRQRRQAREVAKREIKRLLAEHEEQRHRLRLPPLSPEQREAVIDGFRQRVVVPRMTAPCRGPTFRCCKIGCARLMTPWSEREPKLPSIKEAPV
jgi:hypothetical protein